MKNKKTLGVLGLTAAALVGGTFAYFTQTSSIDNPFDTAKYGTVVTEEFKPEDGHDWQPGAEVNKDLYVDNTGDRAVVVRVKFEDIWSRDGAELIAPGSTDSMEVWQEDKTDGQVTGDKSVVHKYFAPDSSSKWSGLQEDGYYYYLVKLDPKATTDKFLDSVRLDAETDMGKFMTQYYYTEEKERPTVMPGEEGSVWKKAGEPQPVSGSEITPQDGWTFTTAITEPEKGSLGYSDANYILRITVETVQATDKAVQSVFSTAPEEIVSGWQLDKEDLEENGATE